MKKKIAVGTLEIPAGLDDMVGTYHPVVLLDEYSDEYDCENGVLINNNPISFDNYKILLDEEDWEDLVESKAATKILITECIGKSTKTHGDGIGRLVYRFEEEANF